MAKVKVTVKRTGGKKLRRLLREAGKSGVSAVKVGFFSTARYEDGTPVAAVAAWNEFGTEPHTIAAKPGKVLAFTGSGGETVFSRQVNHPGIPERPFFRRAIAEMKDGVSKIVKSGLDPKKMVVDEQLADRVGLYAAGQVQESIVALNDPPNSPATIAQKRKKLHGKKGTGGGETPLLDTGTLRNSVSWEVEQ